MRYANCFADPKLGSISSLRCQKSRTRIPKDARCEVMFRGRCLNGSLSIFNSIWWSQTGSNRRPHACKARALPAELWPRTRRRMLRYARRRPSGYAGHASFRLPRGCATRSRRRSVVGLGRLELPTSRLSSARSNQLSYKPLTTRSKIARVSGSTPLGSHNRSPWRVFVREERET